MNLLHGNKFSPWEDFFVNPFGSDVVNPNQLCKCIYMCTVEVKKVYAPFAYRFYYRSRFHYRCNYHRAFLLPFAFSLLLQLPCACIMRLHSPLSFTLSPATVAENTPLQVATMFVGRVCRRGLAE